MEIKTTFYCGDKSNAANLALQQLDFLRALGHEVELIELVRGNGWRVNVRMPERQNDIACDFVF